LHHPQNQLTTPTTPSRIRHIAGQFRLDSDSLSRALALSGAQPTRATFAHAAARFLLIAGTALIVAGVTAFFAFNWADLGRLAKFGLIEAGLAAAVVFAWRQGIDSPSGRAALFGAGFLVGVLLAVFGQAYQTGADPYGLFLGWGALILGWAVIGRQPGLWLLMAVLGNLTVALYWAQVLHPPEEMFSEIGQVFGPLAWLGFLLSDFRLAQIIFALDGAFLVAWEIGARRGVAWMGGRWLPRLLAFFAVAAIADASLLVIFDGPRYVSSPGALATPGGLLVFCALALWYYRTVQHDLFMLAVSLLALIVVFSAFCARYLVTGFDGSLLLSLLLLAQMAGTTAWLRHVSRSWRKAA
jgi:uncharacterized membrane protein